MNIITGCQIYWLTRCDELKTLLCPGFGWGLLWFLSTAAFIVSSIIAQFLPTTEEGSDPWILCKGGSVVSKITKPMFIVFSALIVLGASASALIPTTKEMAAIVVIPKVANSQPVQDIGQGIVDLAKDWMRELSPKKVSKEDLKNKVADTVDAAVKTAKVVNKLVPKDGEKNGDSMPAEK